MGFFKKIVIGISVVFYFIVFGYVFGVMIRWSWVGIFFFLDGFFYI